MANLKLTLVKDLARHLRAGHPWVFRHAIAKPPKLPAGAIVDVVDQGHFVARGFYDPYSSIAVRILTRDEGETIDASFFRRRLARAWALRESLLDRSQTDSFRVVHGESDGLPGVILDLYAGFAVLKLYSAGLTPHRATILDALRAVVPGVRGIIGRDETDREPGEGDEGKAPGKSLWGEPAPELVAIKENGASFLVDVLCGQKTGFFLDQRDNRRLVRDLARGREVLNCFSYTGGFSVNAALGGATRVTSVDLDADAIALARRNFRENGIAAEAHDFIAADVGEVLKSFAAQGRRFGLVILDPPAYAKSQKAVDAAVAGYASLNRVALSVLEKSGILCTSSCTARVSAADFFGAVKEAGFKAGVDLQLIHERYQPPDHPILLQFPEGRYLKFLALRQPE
jgi:23S rRNA (cytosine1962-C5)-methyltransferase